jgi:transposase
MLYVGLDTHLRTTTACVLDTNGKHLQTKTIKGPWSIAADWLETFVRVRGEQVTVCFEASCGYGTLHDRLTTFCRTVQVAHPGKLRLIFQSKRKSDRVDARKLAKLLYLGEVPRAHVPSPEVRARRELVELRRALVQRRNCVYSRIRGLLRSHAVNVPGVTDSGNFKGLWTAKGRTWLAGLAWPSAAATLRAELLLDELDHVSHQLKRLTDELDRLAGKDTRVALLETIPGVGPRTAEAAVAYLDDPKRFGRTKQAAAYVGLVPRSDCSGGRERLGRITKEGPATLRWLLVQSAWQAVRRSDYWRAAFDRVWRGRAEAKKKALVAVAHKLIRTMQAMLRDNRAWAPPGTSVKSTAVA